MKWYNDLRLLVSPQSPQLIEAANENAVGILLISNGSFFDQVVDTFRFDSSEVSSNFVERTTNRLLNLLVGHLNSMGYSQISQYNLDTPPFLHSQSLGYLSGIAEYISGDNVALNTERMETLKRHSNENGETMSPHSTIMGLTLHPRYGGWFAYRGLLVFDDVSWPVDSSKPTPIHFLTENRRHEAIIEFNINPELGYWRDLNDCSQGSVVRYSCVQYAFFHERSALRRRRMLELLIGERDRSTLP